MILFRLLRKALPLCLLLLACSLSTVLAAPSDQRLNRSGYISVTMTPLLAESNLWDTTYRDPLNQLFMSRTEEFAESLAEGLEKTAFRGRLRVLPGYLPEEHNAMREAVEPDNFLLTVDLHSSYGLSDKSTLAACLSGSSCFLLAPLNMFTYKSRTEASVRSFYITPDGKKLRLTQSRYEAEGKVSGDFFEAMNMAQELEWITRLTDKELREIKGKVLAELPSELVRRSWRKAGDELSRPAAGGTAGPPLPPRIEVAEKKDEEAPAPEGERAGKKAPARGLNLEDLVRQVSPSVFKVRTEGGTGSGFVLSSRGFGLTSLHVVEGAKSVVVRFHNGEEISARVVLSEPSLDAAVVSFPAENLNPMPLGDSDRLSGAEKLIAVGYPQELGLSVVPSRITSLETYRGIPLIRIENALAPGNSGGALVNEEGKAIGLIFRKDIQGAHPTTYAIPINKLRGFFEHLLDAP